MSIYVENVIGASAAINRIASRHRLNVDESLMLRNLLDAFQVIPRLALALPKDDFLDPRVGLRFAENLPTGV